MPSRKTHTKSRHGCRECKFRKVKCDETRPQCQRCANRQTPCNYSEPFRINNVQESTSPRTLVSTPSPSQIEPAPTYPHLPQFLRLPVLSPNGTSTQINHLGVFFAGSGSPAPHTGTSSVSSDRQEANYPKNRDMELLHHYTTSACLTLHSNNEQRDIWQISIPKLAFSNAYLLHGILCLSACHISFQGQNVDEYNQIAKYHYTTALSLFRPLLDRIDKETGPPIVSFAMLLTILSMAMPRADAPEEAKGVDYIKYMVNNTRLIMGVRDVLSQCWPFIRETVIAPVLAVNRESGIEALGFEAEVAMKCIETRIQSDITDPELRQEYMEVTKVLRDCNPRREGGNTLKHTVVLAWPALIPPRFFKELDEKKPIAMAILLFFGALLHTLNDLWWADDKGKRLVEAIVEILPRGWESVIVWGKISVGLPCDYTPLNQ